jgi:hypothetical protein
MSAHPNVLLVEGKDDEHVLYSLLEHHAVPEVFTIKNKDGITNILESLDVEIDASGLERIGIVVDADLDLDARWQSLRDILTTRCGYHSLPDRPDALGTVIEQEGRPVIGLWLMPDNVLPGMIEHFVEFLVPDGDSLWRQAAQCIAGIPAAERRFAENHAIKAHVHTYLAWQSDPGTPLGLAITKRYLDADSPHAQRLITWLRRLFQL